MVHNINWVCAKLQQWDKFWSKLKWVGRKQWSLAKNSHFNPSLLFLTLSNSSFLFHYVPTFLFLSPPKSIFISTLVFFTVFFCIFFSSSLPHYKKIHLIYTLLLLPPVSTLPFSSTFNNSPLLLYFVFLLPLTFQLLQFPFPSRYPLPTLSFIQSSPFHLFTHLPSPYVYKFFSFFAPLSQFPYHSFYSLFIIAEAVFLRGNYARYFLRVYY